MLTPQVCIHTENKELACAPCAHPFWTFTKPTNDKFNKFTNNISWIVIEDSAPEELLNAFVAAGV